MLITDINTISGVIMRNSDIPADLMAISSLCSARLPNVIMELSKTANGKAIGTKLADAYDNNSSIIRISNPFPTKSSMYFQRNCIKSRKMAIKKVNTNGPMYDLRMNLCKRFTASIS